MHISIFELLSIGIGPSSSHTVGPMRAAYLFLEENKTILNKAVRLVVNLYGSLALTGKGHCTDYSIVLGLSGLKPESVDVKEGLRCYEEVCSQNKIKLLGEFDIELIQQ